MKAWLTPLCFIAIPVLYMFVWIVGLSLNGFIFWTGTVVLTIFGFHFTKFLPDVEENFS